MNQIKIGIVIPAYNEEIHVSKTFSQIKEIILRSSYNFQLFITDDASTDKTLALIKEEAEKQGLTDVLNLYENQLNIGGALTTKETLQHALDSGMDYIIKFDLDDNFNKIEVLNILLLDIPQESPEIISSGLKETYINSKYEKELKNNLFQLLKKLGLDTYDPAIGGVQLYPKELLQKLLTEPIVRNFKERWGFDVLLPLLAHSKGYKTKFIGLNLENLGPRSTEKIKDQCKTWERIINSLSKQIQLTQSL